MASATHRSYCRNCIAACGMRLEVENNRIVDYDGDKDNPVTNGYRCVKGDMAAEMPHSAERLRISRRRRPQPRLQTMDGPDSDRVSAEPRMTPQSRSCNLRTIVIFRKDTSYHEGRS